MSHIPPYIFTLLAFTRIHGVRQSANSVYPGERMRKVGKTWYQFRDSKSAIHRTVSSVANAFARGNVWRSKEAQQFVFLCGANRTDGKGPSARRQAILEFARTNLPNARFFLAESVFDVLAAEGNHGNLLDIEHQISQFADHILVILESNSAFCELGAFALNPDLRKKLIVINDNQHINSRSFITLGPLAAMRELEHEHKILFYSMDHSRGNLIGDGIGELYQNLHELLFKFSKPKREKLALESCDPKKHLDKDSIRFVHDLICFSAPVRYAEIVEMLKIIFGPGDYKNVQQHLGLLKALGEINRNKNNNYVSASCIPYFDYDHFDRNDILAAFNMLYQKLDPERLVWI